MEFNEAEGIYRKVIKNNPNHLDANYLLGTLYVQCNNFGDAERYLTRAEAINPASPMVKVNLANLYRVQKKYDKAVEGFTRAIALKPDLPQAYFGLGSVLEETGEDEQRVSDCYFRALSLDSNIPEVHQSVGRIFFKACRPEAVEHFEIARRLNPQLKGIYKDLGLAYLRGGKTQKAVEALVLAETESPDDVAVRYYMAVAHEREPDQELKELFCTEEFDRFAKTFDELLVGKLNYKAPSQLIELLRENCGNDVKFNNVIDLGCGTGLSGIAFRNYAEFLTGIDISGRMLEAAAARKCYDLLLQGSIVEQLNNGDAVYDLFIAADVFIYLGGLDKLLATVKTKASRHAMLVFSTECCDGEGFVLKASGRYAHSPKYIESQADLFGFEVVSEKRVKLRTEGPNWIMGDVYLLICK
jgi:predicted TPR repeat methyltransferase